MSWTLTDPMLERAKLIDLYNQGLYSASELAQRFGASRKTVYKWIERYREGGSKALADRSHTAHRQPNRTPPEVEAAIVACRKAHPSWGPKKLLTYLDRHHPDMSLPAASTAGTILKRHGLVEARARRSPATAAQAPPSR